MGGRRLDLCLRAPTLGPGSGPIDPKMPIYEFQCGSCGKRSDHLMRLSDPDPAACPACGAKRRVEISSKEFRNALVA